MTVTIGRRELLAAIGGAAAAWPFAARAQQRGETPRVGYIRAGTPHNDPFREEFMRGMRDLGYVEGRNILVHRDDPDQEDAVEGSSSARMVAEKVAAIADAQAAAITKMIMGGGMAAATKSASAIYQRKVRTNRRRLTRR